MVTRHGAGRHSLRRPWAGSGRRVESGVACRAARLKLSTTPKALTPCNGPGDHQNTFVVRAGDASSARLALAARSSALNHTELRAGAEHGLNFEARLRVAQK